MSHEFVISVMTRDRVGIVADVTGAIQDLGGNLADLSQTVLGGYFTMILIASFPPGVREPQIRARLVAIDPADPFEVGVRLHRASRRRTPAPAEPLYVLTAAGPDKTGLVATLSRFLREKEINIEDFSTLVKGDVYWMFLNVRLPKGADVGDLKREAQAAMDSIGVKVELMHQAIFQATNEV